MKRTLKLLHVLGAMGVTGSFAASIVLLTFAPATSPVAFAAVRASIAMISKWLLVPSLALVLISGLLAIAVNRAFHDAGWAWIKALLGISMFEGTLLTVAASASRAADLSKAALAGGGNMAELAQVLRTEWNSLWFLLGLAMVNIVLAVWRPRLVRRTSTTAQIS
jgi:Predicted integral membrane protein (DUF2269)